MSPETTHPLGNKYATNIPQVPYEEYIGAKLFEPGYRERMVGCILDSDRRLPAVSAAFKSFEAQGIYLVKQARIDRVGSLSRQFPSERKRVLEAKVDQEIQQILDSMICDMSSTQILRFFAFVVKTLLSRLYHRGIYINESEIEELRKVALIAQEKNLPLIFLPCHKSHIDYLVVSYVLYRRGLALPHIAAGDNLNMLFLGWLLRHNGAFFIRRQWGDDKLYSAIMHEYVMTLLEKGHNLEVFIEGTRSRTGKLLRPKLGMLKISIEALLSGRISDAYIVPISLGYDKVIETPSYVDELLGTPKQKESLFQLLNNVNILQLKWGRIDVHFAKAFSLKEYLQTETLRRGWGDRIPVNPEMNSILLQSLGYKVLNDVNQASVVMPTALVGTVLLTLRGRGVGRNELIRKVIWLRNQIREKGGRVAAFGDTNPGRIVDRAIEVFGDLIGRRPELLEPVFYPTKRFELSYYRNQVIHLFIPEAVVSLGVYATIKAGGPISAQLIPLRQLKEDVSFLSQLLKKEFVFSGGGLEKNLDDTVGRLIQSNVFMRGKSDASLNYDSDWVTLSHEERRIGRETFDFYCFLLWPFVETYWLATVSLYTILPESDQCPGSVNWVDEKTFMKRCQLFGKTLYYEGDLSYFESINKEGLANAFSKLSELGVLQYHTGSMPPSSSPVSVHEISSNISKTPSTQWVSVSPDWIPAESLPQQSGLVESASPNLLRGPSSSSISSAAKLFANRQNRPLDIKAPRANSAHSSTWNGPLDIYTTAPHKSMVDDEDTLSMDESISTSILSTPSTASLRTDSTYKGNETNAPSFKPIESDENEKVNESWMQMRPSGRLWNLCETIGRYRREGKNRRDTNTVAIRVLRLARWASESSQIPNPKL